MEVSLEFVVHTIVTIVKETSCDLFACTLKFGLVAGLNTSKCQLSIVHNRCVYGCCAFDKLG